MGLSVSTASITFPVTGTGTKSTPVALTIGNSGSVTLLVNVDASAVMETGAFKVTGAGPFKLPHGHTKAIKVTFAPSSAGTFGGNMNIAANNSSNPVTVMVTGSAQSGTLSAPATLSFGSVAVHHSQTQTLTIQNTGLGVLKGRVVASGLKKPFQLLSGGGAFTLSTEKMRVVKVKFAPASDTPSGTAFTGTVTITSDDPANMSQSVAVSGNGT
ncbi:MAG: choice-of-anchor D domain-containing protein [Candidatus Binatales bacterium]